MMGDDDDEIDMQTMENLKAKMKLRAGTVDAATSELSSIRLSAAPKQILFYR